MELTDRDKETIKNCIDRGEPLPAKYKLMLFADAPEVELIWQGKTSEVTNVVLPFQSIEQIDEPRQQVGQQVDNLFAADYRGRQTGGWTNKLIWGDNKLILSSLKNGPLRRQIEDAGGLKLIYIDPPFDVGADFSVNIEVGDGETLTKEPSVIEEFAYRDTWGRGTDSYVSMIYERLKLMHGLLAQDGSIYVHCDWKTSAYMKMALDELYGRDNFLGDIVWYYYNKMATGTRKFSSAHDRVLFYARNRQSDYIFHPPEEKRDQPVQQLRRKYFEGRAINVKDESGAVQYRIREMRRIDDVWRIACLQPADRTQNTGYETQKPETLVERIVNASSNPGDLVADFFCGSGTTLAVAEKLGRKWIGCDLGRFAIHTTRKRLIGVQRELKAAGQPYRSFEILNLGKYERQYFAGIDPTLPEEQRKAQTIQREEHYLNLILSAYKAERVFQLPPFHGKKGSNLVLVGPIDAPVTLSQITEVIAECRKNKISKVDVLGFEFEMGLTPVVQDEAKQKGINLSLKYIPKDVFDKRAIERGQVQFYDVAYVQILPRIDGLNATVTLQDFGVFYQQDGLDMLGEKLKNGGSKVTVEGGQVVKVSKDKQGLITREILTKKWTHWIDYWAVDFHFESKREILRVVEDGQEREIWTGNYIFENEWQSYRTRKDRKLELTSGTHSYSQKGRYKIAVKVIDIFGNDTTKVVEVRV
jgi:DNA modification methylase